MFQPITIEPDETGQFPQSVQVCDDKGNEYTLAVPLPVPVSSQQYDDQITDLQTQLGAATSAISGWEADIVDRNNYIAEAKDKADKLQKQIDALTEQKTTFVAKIAPAPDPVSEVIPT